MTKKEHLMEYIARDVIEYLMVGDKTDMKEAMSQFFNSAVYEKLRDPDTGLYLLSSAYVYDLFRDELGNGKIIQQEI
jgi:hypothetical protein